eukprot:maker-scaffold33_size549341-snap-gene-1.18 protein:Tk11523 transcript:maker-scaffold33_size549341-snap-gene-1.18-mRNA-1 annotation:"hypothetical protein HELRODRAFT_173416"
MSRVLLHSLVYLLIVDIALGLMCFSCNNCGHTPLRHLPTEECKPEENNSCMMTVAKFAQYRVISRGCSKAPVFNMDGCVGQTINIMRTEVCICGTDLCNGEYHVTETIPEEVNSSSKLNHSAPLFYVCALSLLRQSLP